MSLLRVIARSLAFHWRIHAAVALGVMAATAVLTGALAVGDSVRYSLRRLTLDRLGRIDEVLIVDRFLRQELASELAAQPRFKELYASATPAILFPSATAESAGEKRRLAANVQVLGIEPAFWELGIGTAAAPPERSPAEGEVVLNAPLAEELNAQVGDMLALRFGTADQVPADSPLGRRSGQVASLAELKVSAIIPAEGLGRFSLQPSQIPPRSAFVSLAAMQAALDVPGKTNTIFIGGRNPALPAPPEASAELAKLLTPRLADYGLALKHVEMKFGEGDEAQTIYDYFSLSSERMLLDDPARVAALRAFGGQHARPLLTYLANSIEKVEQGAASDETKGIPYSTITAIDPAPGGPLVDGAGKPLPNLADDEIALTSWAAEDQQAKVGDRVRVTWFEPETTHGDERETSEEFRVAAIVPLTEPAKGFERRSPAIYEQPPTPANDPDLTPEVKGITDQESIARWDPPFPFDRNRLRHQDDTYWENHRTTPKAYVSLRTGQRLWGSRFGKATSIRIPATPGMTIESLEKQFLDEVRHSGQRLGLDFVPIKRQGLAASAGTTPFDVLFLLLSMFIIASALVLIWLLFRLGVEQRAGEVGLLLALGWQRPQVGWLLLLEGGIVAAVGAALGVLAGIAYAWLMLVGLRTWWVGAIATPFLTLHVTPLSAAIGFVAGLFVSLLTIWFSLGRVKRAVVRSLLAGEIVPAARNPQSAIRNPKSAIGLTATAALLFLAAASLAFYAATLGGEAQAGAFLGAGAALLTSLLLLTIAQLRAAGRKNTLLGEPALGRLAFRNAGRNVGRSAATIALVAAAAFLIVAVSAFRMSPTEEGVGGFDLLAESSQPIYVDLNSEAGRRELLGGKAAQLAGSTILALRLKAGDDASCRNLYTPSQPRILGVTPQWIEYFDDPQLPARFRWSASAAKSPAERANPWRLLSAVTPPNEPVPVVLDQNTAMYSLRLYRGIGEIYKVKYADGREVSFRVAGLLAGSVLQGSLLIGEGNFQRLFPQISGYRSFLIRTPAGKAADVAALLEDQLGDQGFDTTPARQRLAELLAVQNTYISTFQSLGALGLVLGTFGLAAVQLRSVFERRKELALMRAAGFRRRRLGNMVLLENLLLLVGGLLMGALAALVAVLPQMILGGASVPLVDLALTLGVVLLIGVITGLTAVGATLRAPLVGALRGE
jgi:ABC-type antimicrobial peptide transport system permease subunit